MGDRRKEKRVLRNFKVLEWRGEAVDEVVILPASAVVNFGSLGDVIPLVIDTYMRDTE